MNLASKLFVPQNKIEPSKPIVHYPGMSKSEEENVIRFFNALAPENPSAIDLPLIVDQGFPVFEKVLGPNKWAKLKKHYCIGFKRAVVLKTHDLNSLLYSHLINSIPQGQLKGYMLQLCAGVNYLHSVGIIHRDLKRLRAHQSSANR